MPIYNSGDVCDRNDIFGYPGRSYFPCQYRAIGCISPERLTETRFSDLIGLVRWAAAHLFCYPDVANFTALRHQI